MRLFGFYVPNLRFNEDQDDWKLIRINSLLKFQNGINASPEKYGKGTKYISVSDILNNKFITNKNIKGLIDIDDKTLKNFEVSYGDILFQRSSETIEDIGRTNVYLDKNTNSTFGGFVIRGKKIGHYNPIFFKYLLDSPTARKSVIRMGAGAQHYNISQEGLDKIKLHFPNDFIQEKIANLFMLLDNCIETQSKIIEDYKTYKNRILHTIYNSIESDKRIKLNDICSITTGKLDANAMNPNGKYKFFTCAKEDYYIDTYSFDGEALVISGNGEVGLIKYFNGKFDAYQRTYVLQNFIFNPLYIKFALEIELPKKICKEKNVGAMPYIVLSTLSNIMINIPSNETIEKIAKLVVSLDKKIAIEEKILNDYIYQKKYLLSNMFI